MITKSSYEEDSFLRRGKGKSEAWRKRLQRRRSSRDSKSISSDESQFSKARFSRRRARRLLYLTMKAEQCHASPPFSAPAASKTSPSRGSLRITTTGLSNPAAAFSALPPSTISARALSWYVLKSTAFWGLCNNVAIKVVPFQYGQVNTQASSDILDCSDRNNSKYYVVVVQVLLFTDSYTFVFRF